jgi:hypothetical protein
MDLDGRAHLDSGSEPVQEAEDDMPAVLGADSLERALVDLVGKGIAASRSADLDDLIVELAGPRAV